MGARWADRFLVAGVVLLAYLYVDGGNIGGWYVPLFSIMVWCLMLGLIGRAVIGLRWVIRRVKGT